MLVPYKVRVELIGVNTTFGVYIGRSIDEPLPADFASNPEYVIGEIMTLVVPVTRLNTHHPWTRRREITTW